MNHYPIKPIWICTEITNETKQGLIVAMNHNFNIITQILNKKLRLKIDEIKETN